MPILTIRNVPDDVYDRLKSRAAANRRSINSEAIEVLRLGVVGRTERDVAGYLTRARALREATTGMLTDGAIDLAKRSGRA